MYMYTDTGWSFHGVNTKGQGQDRTRAGRAGSTRCGLGEQASTRPGTRPELEEVVGRKGLEGRASRKLGAVTVTVTVTVVVVVVVVINSLIN
jgi:hypothetical protein